jgi:uncharacterized membrane protein YcaP (DUF421 family)
LKALKPRFTDKKQKNLKTPTALLWHYLPREPVIINFGMKKEEIHWADWHRILLGTAPVEFLLEVLIRTAIMYLVLLVILRLLGKRMGGQLTISELAVMLTLGAIISVPMQAPDKGILQGILVLICALAFQRGINYLAVKNEKIERVTQGRESLIVRDGVLAYDQLTAMKISREQMIAVLRSQKIYNLGEVGRVYIEACGLFSVYKYPTAKPGLSLLPPDDGEAASVLTPVEEAIICGQCGAAAEIAHKENSTCNNCGADNWEAAVINKQS